MSPESPTIQHEPDKEWHIEEVLKVLGVGKIQYITLVTCGMISLSLLNQLMGMTFIMAAAQCDLGMSTSDKGLFASVTFIGVMVPAFMWGYLSDTFGRRRIMMLSLGCSIIAAFLSSLAPDFLTFLIIRFFVGFFLAGPSSCFLPYIGEIVPLEKRSSIMAWVTSVGSIGYLYIPLLPMAILSLDLNVTLWGGMIFRSWRLILLALAFPGVIALIILHFLPESPKYLLSRGRKTDALKVLAWIYEKNTKNSADSFPVKVLAVDEGVPFQARKESGCLGIIKLIVNQASPLFKPPHLCNFLVLLLSQISVFCVGTGIGLWFTELQNRLSKTNYVGTVCEVINYKINKTTYNVTVDPQIVECDDSITDATFMNSIILGSCCIVGLLLISFATKVFSRTLILEVNLIGSTLSGLALQFLVKPEFVVVAFCLFITFAITSISVVYGLAVLLFPTNVRSMSQGIAATVGRLGASLCGILIGLNIETHCEATFGLITGLVFVAGCFNFLLPFK